MRFLVIFLLLAIVVGCIVGFYYYQEEYRPALSRYDSLIKENRTLAEYISTLRNQVKNSTNNNAVIEDDTIIEYFDSNSTKQVFEGNVTGLRITLPVENLFNPGEFKLNGKGRSLVKKTAEIINRIENTEIAVEGHTDNEKIGPTLKKTIPTNWELSSLRSVEVVKFLQDSCGIEPSRLSSVAYGQTRPIADNSTSEGRQKNRRIDIFIKYLDAGNNMDNENVPEKAIEEPDTVSLESGEEAETPDNE